MNEFGGSWTEIKMEIVQKYARAYLTIMNKYKDKYNWKLLYFDGFAGSGHIRTNENESIDGMAKMILNINQAAGFDFYYFVELDRNNAESLKTTLETFYPQKADKIFVVQDDCNTKLTDLAAYLKSHRDTKAFVFIDPYGMSLNWNSISQLRGLSVDLWLLIPTGIGPNRLLRRDGKIPENWYKKLSNFLGLSKQEIEDEFYATSSQLNLFGEDEIVKEKNTIEKIHHLYVKKLNTVFNYVSMPYVIRNSTGSIMYHFLFASKNKNAVNIANDIINKFKV